MSSADLKGSYVVITGANTGIGAATAKALAARGADVLLASRSKDKTMPVVEAIRAAGGVADFLSLDLGRLDGVRAASDEIAKKGRAIDVLLNNAGVAGQRGETADGFELQFGTNHLGHFLLTVRVLPLLRAAPRSRVVMVASRAHLQAKGIDFAELRRSTRTITGLDEYAVSKLANILFAKELARRLGDGASIHTYSLHPGVVASDAWRRIPWPIRPLVTRGMLSNEDGAKTSLYCATSDEAGKETGLYYDDCRVKAPTKLAEDPELAKTLWGKSVEWTGADLS